MTIAKPNLSRPVSSRRCPALVELLESRQHLSVDLTVNLLTPAVPPSVVVGKAARGRVSLELSNLSAVPVARSTRIEVQVLAVSSGQPDGVLVGRARSVNISGLADGARPRRVNVPVVLPRTLPAGDYQLVVSADPDNRLSEAAATRTNNLAALTTPVVVDVPFSRLTVQGMTYRLPRTEPGSRGTAQVLIRNLGNVSVRGAVNIRVLASPTAAGVSAVPVELGRVDNARVAVGANKVVRFSRNLRIVAPVNAGFASASYVVFAEITPVSLSVADRAVASERRGVASNNLPLPPLQRTAQSPLIPGVTRTLFFTTTQSFGDPAFGVAEAGTVVDSAGRTGQYTYAFVPASGTLPQSTAFSLQFGTGPRGEAPFTADYLIDFAGEPLTTFAGRRVEFGVDAGLGVLRIKQTADPGVGFRLIE